MPKFLILRFSSLGDLVLTTPVIRCLKQQVPGAEIHFCMKKAFAEALEHNPYIDRRIYMEDSVSALITELQNEKYDAIIDLHHNIRTWRIKRGLKTISH